MSRPLCVVKRIAEHFNLPSGYCNCRWMHRALLPKHSHCTQHISATFLHCFSVSFCINFFLFYMNFNTFFLQVAHDKDKTPSLTTRVFNTLLPSLSTFVHKTHLKLNLI